MRREPPNSTERYTRWINQLASDQLLTQVLLPSLGVSQGLLESTPLVPRAGPGLSFPRLVCCLQGARHSLGKRDRVSEEPAWKGLQSGLETVGQQPEGTGWEVEVWWAGLRFVKVQGGLV